jgi:tetratricopeptide (TPR) repeat protein
MYRLGRYAEAGVAFHRGAQLFEGGDQQVRLRFEGAAWSAEWHLRPAQRGPERTVDGNGPGDRAILAVQALRETLTTPPAARGADLAIRALGDGALLAEQGSQGPSVTLAILALLHCGRVVEAHDAADAAVRDACVRGAQLAYADASLMRAFVLYVRGRITDAAADAQAAIDLIQHHGHPQAQTALAILVHCMIERGELKEAARIFERAGEELTPTPAMHAYVSLARGRLHLRLNDIDAARKDLDAAENALRDLGAANPTMVPWRSLAGVVAHPSGDEARSRSLIKEEIRLARSFDVPIALGIALRRRAHTEAGDQALESFKEAVSVLENTEAKLEPAPAPTRGLGVHSGAQVSELMLEVTWELVYTWHIVAVQRGWKPRFAWS